MRRVSQESNAREFTRVNTRINIVLSTGESKNMNGAVKDVSANGVYVSCEGEAPEGTECHVEIALSEDPAGPVIKGHGRVVRVEADGLAINFTEIIGEDSFVHLRNLVLYNAKQIDSVEAKFSKHAGIKPIE